MTPYLSADWFRLWKVALAEAEAPGHERLDLRRGFLPVGLCRRTGARRDAGVARPRPVLHRSQTAGKSGRRRAGRLPPRRRRLRRRHRPGPPRRDAARRQVSGRCRSPRHQFSLARRQVVCRSDLSGRDAEVPGDHPRGLPARDRRPVRQARARLFLRRAEPDPGRRHALDRRFARAVPQALGIRPHAQPGRPCAARGRLETRPPQLLSGRLGAHYRALGQALCRVLPGPRAGVHRALLGARVATCHGRARQHGHVCLAAAPGDRLPAATSTTENRYTPSSATRGW